MVTAKVVPTPKCLFCASDALSGHPACMTHLAMLAERSRFTSKPFSGVLPFRKSPWSDGRGPQADE